MSARRSPHNNSWNTLIQIKVLLHRLGSKTLGHACTFLVLFIDRTKEHRSWWVQTSQDRSIHVDLEILDPILLDLDSTRPRAMHNSACGSLERSMERSIRSCLVFKLDVGRIRYQIILFWPLYYLTTLQKIPAQLFRVQVWRWITRPGWLKYIMSLIETH